jgi:serine/threonine protein kinase
VFAQPTIRVRHRVTGRLYLLKCVRKDELVSVPAALSMHKHAFIVTLAFMLQSPVSLTFVFDNVAGEFFGIAARARATLSDEHLRFYGAEILLALEYMHSRGVLYPNFTARDVFLQDDGHVALSPFFALQRQRVQRNRWSARDHRTELPYIGTLR